ncbi:MAG TPA: efflux RND transporter periplasmic adaptor subunit [Puia sp.]|nr:efflux RND transporter periplasmic adaptor subunit [Puia sp.]
MHKAITVVLGFSLLLAACGSSSIQKDDSLAGKRSRLDSLKAQQEKLNKQISDLQDQIAKIDTSAATKEKAKLVALTSLAPTSFTHYIDLQGNVDAVNYSNIAPQGNGGVVRQIFVKQGDHVTKGQLLLKLDDAVQRQQLDNAQIALDHAKDLYQRHKNLWDEKIGAEVDLINAKNQVDEAEVQVKIYQEQLNWTNVYSDIPGTVNYLNLRVGELFSPAVQAQALGPNNPAQLQVMNTDNLKVVVQVPDVYQERIRVGTPVKITLPGLNNKEINGVVHTVSPVINQSNRAFNVEVYINDKSIRANQVAIVKLQDYTASNVLTIPINTLQTDENGKYVMVAMKDKDRLVAHKKSITIGQTYADKVQVLSGLDSGDQLISDGFQGLYENQLITTH